MSNATKSSRQLSLTKPHLLDPELIVHKAALQSFTTLARGEMSALCLLETPGVLSRFDVHLQLALPLL